MTFKNKSKVEFNTPSFVAMFCNVSGSAGSVSNSALFAAEVVGLGRKSVTYKKIGNSYNISSIFLSPAVGNFTFNTVVLLSEGAGLTPGVGLGANYILCKYQTSPAVLVSAAQPARIIMNKITLNYNNG